MRPEPPRQSPEPAHPQGPAQPQPGWARRRPVARAPREAWERPVRVEPVPETPYGLVVYGSPPVTSGPAIGALTAGVAAVTVALVVLCFGLAGASSGWGPLVAGAFGVLAAALGGGGIGLGVVGMRRTRSRGSGGGDGAAGADQVRGRGLALSGLICGAVAVALTAGALGLSLLMALV